jgi:A/G-specific adenine glycosylase
MAETVEANGHGIDVVAFRRALIAWGKEHFRFFPWRRTGDPYLILMAEVMLHRTQARQVVPLYEEFAESYPDLQALSRINRKRLRQMFYSLGLHSRTDLIHKMAAEIMKRHDGRVPDEKSDLLGLPGLSEYIASAVRCFAWNRPEPIIDTNTVRVTGRLFGLEVKDSSRRNRRFRELIGALLDPENPRAYNYALLDLADQVCTKKRPPDCHNCPVLRWCHYGTSVVGNT